MELLRCGSIQVGKTAETKNMSSSGVLFSSEAPMAVGDPIEYMITLPNSEAAHEVRLRCVGKVIRHDQTTAAATLERYEFVRE